MAAGEVVIEVNADTGKLEGSLRGLESTFKSVLGSNLVSSLIEKTFGNIGDTIDSAISRVDTLNRFPKVLENMGYNAATAEQSIQELSAGIQGLPTTLDDVAATAQNLTVLTGDLEEATDTTLALNNAFLASGSTAENAARGLNQYVQMLSRGNVDLESWRTLQETMGYALRQVAESFGYAGEAAVNDLYAALQSGEITFDAFNSRIIELNGAVGGFADMAQTSAQGIGTAMTNAHTAVVRGVGNIITAFDGMINIQGSIAAAGKGIETVLTGIADNLNIIIPIITGVTVAVLGWKASAAVTNSFRASTKSLGDTMRAVDGDVDKLRISITQKTAAAANAVTETLKEKAAETQATAERLKAVAAQKQATAEEKKAVAAKLEKIAALKKEAAEAAKQLAATKKGEAAAKAEADAMEKTEAAIKAEMQAERAATTAKKADTAAAQANAAAEKAAADATKAATAAQQGQNVTITAGQAVVGLFTGQLSIMQVATIAAKSAMEKLSAAFLSNPIGAVVSVISMAVTAGEALSEALSTASDEAVALAENAEEALNRAKEAQTELSTEVAGAPAAWAAQIAETDKIISSMDGLIGKTNLTVAEQSKLESSVSALNAIYPEWGLELDENNRLINTNTGEVYDNTDALQKNAEQLMNQAKIQAAQERYGEAWGANQDALRKQQKQAEELADEMINLGLITDEDKDAAIEWAKTLTGVGENALETLSAAAQEGDSFASQLLMAYTGLSQATGIDTNMSKLVTGMSGINETATITEENLKLVTDDMYALTEEVNSNTEATEENADVREQLADAVSEEGLTVEDLADKWGVSTDEIINAAAEMEGGLSEKLSAVDEQFQEKYDKWIEQQETFGSKVIETNDSIINSFDKVETSMGSFEEGMSNWEYNMEKQEEFNAGLEELATKTTPMVVEQVREMGVAGLDWLNTLNNSPEDLERFRTNVEESYRIAGDSAEAGMGRISDAVVAAFNAQNMAAGFQMTAFGEIISTKTGEVVDQVSADLKPEEFAEWGVNINEGTKAGIEGSKSGVTSAVATGMDEAGQVAEDKAASGVWYRSGYNITSGIAKGVSSGSGILNLAITNVINSALKAAQKAADEHSPSRLFEKKVGLMISAGVAKGVEKGMPMVDAALADLKAMAGFSPADIPIIHSIGVTQNAYITAGQIGLAAQNEILNEQLAAMRGLLNKDWGISVDGRQLAMATNRANANMGAQIFKGAFANEY